MRIKKLRLENFRNYAECEVEMGDHLNGFFGDNAQGKTNLLEALYLLITGRSFRTQRLSDLIREGASHFFIQVEFIKSGVEQTLSIGFDGSEKRILSNDSPCPSFASLFGHLIGGALLPSDKQLIFGAPALRRRFLDIHLSQLNPLYVRMLSRYTRAMRQRNALLKKRETELLDIYEAEMNTCAQFLLLERQACVDELCQDALTIDRDLSDERDELTLSLSTRVTASYQEDLKKHRDKDLLYGITHLGPHRDDLHFSLNGKEARQFASEGQVSCISLSLKLAEWRRLHRHSGEYPIRLIDDIAQNLDDKRQAHLFEHLGGDAQTFLTAPQQLKLPASPAVYLVKSGSVTSHLIGTP